MTKSSHLKSSVFQRFTRAYLGTLIFAAVMIAALLIGVAANSIGTVEIDARQEALSQMAADLQMQSEIMGGVRDNIAVANVYQPGRLRIDKYEEINLLENFATFGSHSPVSSSLFLLYENEEMIYTSHQTKALFKYHFAQKYGMTYAQSAVLMHRLKTLRNAEILPVSAYGGRGDYLFVFPVIFTTGYLRERATLVFEVEARQFLQRMESVSGHAFADYAIYENEKLLLDVGKTASCIAQQMAPRKPNEHLLSSTSMDGRFSVYAHYSNSAFSQAISTYFWQICGAIAALTVIFVVFAVVAAARTSRPIRQLAQRFAQPDTITGYNEFDILETAIQSIESNQKASVRSAKEQFLQLLLHGNGSARMLDQWAQLGVVFDQPCNCVCLVSLPENADAELLVEEIENFADANLRLYAMRPADRPYVVVCCSYQYDYTRSELLDNLSALIDAEQEKVFMGESYDTPLKLPLSYQEARKARHAESSYSQQLGLSYEQVNQRLETIRTAVKCGRVDVVEAELEQLGKVAAASDETIALQRYIYHSLLSCKVSYLRETRQEELARTMESMLVTDYRLFAAEFVKAMRDNQTAMEESNPSVADDIVKYIERNAHDCDLCLDTLTEEFALSADYISQLVKSQTGIPFKEYLIRLRMQLAQKLLLENAEMTINDVASLSGYRTASNFIKRFRETTGMTPAQFRKSREIPQE